jgi:hypothetical protein
MPARSTSAVGGVPHESAVGLAVPPVLVVASVVPALVVVALPVPDGLPGASMPGDEVHPASAPTAVATAKAHLHIPCR